MGGIQPADFVLEKTDCDAFVAMFDKDGKGWLNVEDLGKAFTAQSLSSLKSISDAHSSLDFTGDASFALAGETNEERISALVTHIVTSESIFLTKIQGAILRQLAVTRGTAPLLNKRQIFNELFDGGDQTVTEQTVIDRKGLNRFL